MLLAKDTSPGARAVDVTCIECGKRCRLVHCWSDLHGTPFVAYYCDACAANHPTAPRYVDGIKVKRRGVEENEE